MSAGIAVRRSASRSRLDIASLIIAAGLFIACVIYTIITIRAGFAYLEEP